MAGHSPNNLASMRDPDFMELVWENGQILIRGSSSKITKKSSPLSSSGYSSQSFKARIQLEGGTSTANGSKDGVADSTLADPLSGLSSSLTKLDRHHDNNKIKSRQTGYPELLSGLYEDGFNVVLGADKKCCDMQLIDSNIVVPVNKFNNFKQSYVSKHVEETPQRTMNNDSEVPPRSSLKQYETSIQFMGSKEKKLRIDEESDRVNFSFFFRSPQALIKANHPSSGGTRAMSGPGLAAGAEHLEGNVRSAPRSSDPFENEGNSMARKMKPILPDSEPQKESVPDEQSEAVPNTRFPDKVHGPSSSLASDNVASKGNPGNRKSFEQMVASSSICSRGASNCPTYTLKRRYEDTDHSNNTAMEEPEGTTTKAAPAAPKSKGAKRKRRTEVHKLSERRRRVKINRKMRALKELIPNCNKVDKASMLDEAIAYLKTLQLQVQMMTMGTRVYMPPMMLPSPSAMQHINAQHLGGYSPIGMGMRMQMGLGCGPAQFPTSLMSGAAALPGITAARLNMLGVPADQVLLMSMSRSPFVSSTGGFARQPVQAPGAVVSQVGATAAAQVDLPGAANALSTSKNSNPTN